MKRNVALLDQTVRAGAGLFLLTTPLLDLHTYPFNLLGLVLLATAFAGYCPLYGLVRALLPHGGSELTERKPSAGAY